MGRIPRFAAGFLLLSLVLVPEALAQQRLPQIFTDRQIRGQVVYAGSNRAAANVYVALLSEEGGVVRDTRTGANGRFEFERIPGAVYYLKAEMAGFHGGQSERIDLTLQARSYVVLTLFPKKDNVSEPGSTQALVAVEALAVPEDARQEFEEARKTFDNKGNLETGQRHLQRAIELYPEYYQAHCLLGTSYMDQQRWAEAERALKRSLEINQGYAPSHFALALVYEEQGKKEEALAELERGLQSNPNSWKGHTELAELLLEQGKVAEAETHARRAHELADKELLVHVVLANVLLRKGEMAAAREEYRHYLELAPDGPLAGEIQQKIKEIGKRERELAVSAAPTVPVPPAAEREFAAGKRDADKSEFESALKHYRKATEIHPAFVEAQYAMGMALLDLKRYDEAEQVLRRCLEVKESYSPPYIALGALYNAQQKTAEAIPLLERGVELDPNSWQGHFELAQGLLAQRKPADAEPHARAAHEQQPNEPLVHVLLGNIELSQRDIRTAREEYQHYLDLVPSGPLAEQLQGKIKQIDAVLARQTTKTP